jgi:hypothetical protein
MRKRPFATLPISISKQSSGSRLLLPRRRAVNNTIQNIAAGSHYTNRSQFIPMSEAPDHPERGSERGGRGGDRRGNRSGGGRGGRRAGGEKGEMNREVAVSKALSKLLRHAAEDEGLALDNEGFARLDQVVSPPSLPSLGNSVSHSLLLLSFFFSSANLPVIYISRG